MDTTDVEPAKPNLFQENIKQKTAQIGRFFRIQTYQYEKCIRIIFFVNIHMPKLWYEC